METVDKATTPQAAAFVSLSSIREKLDIAEAIKREIQKIPKGKLILEDEMCRRTAGKDRNRFRRAVDNNAEFFRAHRVKLKLDDGGEGKFFWGQDADIAEAVRIRDL